MNRKMLAIAVSTAVSIADLDASSGAKQWDDYWASPMVVDEQNSDMGAVRVDCEAIDVPYCQKGELEIDCDLTQDCEVAYVARRMLVYPGGYEDKGDAVVDKTVSLTQKAYEKLGNRLVVKVKDGKVLVEIFENKVKTLEIEGWETCGSGSEASMGTTFVGVARTPGAPTFHYGAVAKAGSDPAKGKTVDVLKTAVSCRVVQEFLE